MSLIVPSLKLPQNPRINRARAKDMGLVELWPLSDGGGLTARGIYGGNHGTLVGGVSQAVGPHGRALAFDGVSGAVTIPASAALNGTAQMSVLIRVRWVSLHPSSNRRIFGDVNASGYNFLSFTSGGGTDLGVTWQARDPVTLGGMTPHVGRWIDLVGTYDGAAQRIYLNGVLAASAATADRPPLATGDRLLGSIAADGYVNIEFSAAAVFNRALTAPEIQLLYTRPLAMIDDSVELLGPAGGRIAVAPTILVQPASQSVNEGSDTSLSVVATGDAPLSYQWYLDDVAIAGATSATLALTGVLPSRAGSYTVIVTNDIGSVESDAATLTVFPRLEPPATLRSSFTPATLRTTYADARMTITRN